LWWDHGPSQELVNFDPELEKWKEELVKVKENKLNDSTRMQYLSANAVFVVFLMDHYPHLILPDYLEKYKILKDQGEAKTMFMKGVKDSLEMNRVCPIDVLNLETDVFLRTFFL